MCQKLRKYSKNEEDISKDTVAKDLACANVNIKKLMMTVSDYKSFNKRGNHKCIINFKK